MLAKFDVLSCVAPEQCPTPRGASEVGSTVLRS